MGSAGFPARRHQGALAALRGICLDARSWLPRHAGLSRVAVLLLTGFHAWLFWTHLVSGRLTEPAVASRWGLGLLLASALLALRSASVPLARGRKALVLWVLVAFLHAHAVLAPKGTLTDPAGFDETVVAFVLQTASAASLLGFGLALLAIALGLRQQNAFRPAWQAVPSVAPCRPAAGWRLVRSPRPPPRS